MKSRRYTSQLNLYFLGVVIILIPWIGVLLTRIFGPITYEALSIDLIIYLFSFVFISFLFFTIGFFRFDKTKVNLPYDTVLSYRKKLILIIRRWLLLCTILYILFSCFDFFVVKNASLGDIVALRESENLSGPRNSIIGFFVFLLSGSPPLFASILIAESYKSNISKITSFIIVFMGFSVMFLSGGRNAFFISIIYILIIKVIFSNFYYMKVKFNFRSLSILSLVFVAIVYSLNLFLERYEVIGRDVNSMLDVLEVEYNLGIHRIHFISDEYQPLYSVLVYLSFYITHAFRYLNDYFQIGYSPELLGGYNFYIVSRIIDYLFGTSFFQQANDSILQSGVYLTLPGALYIDFGCLGSLVACSFISVFFGYLTNSLNKCPVSHKLWFAYIAVIMIFSPIYSVISIGNGWSLLVLITSTTFLSIRVRKRD